MKGLVLVVVLVLTGLIGSTCGESTEVVPPEETSILLVQDADSGSLRDNVDGTYTLELTGVPPVIFYDSPDYCVTKISTEDFVTMWDDDGGNNFDGDPPNAALEILNGDPNQDVVTLEILDASYDAVTDTLNCSVRLLESAGGELAAFDSRSVGLTGLPENFEDVVFFVDLGTSWPGRGGDVYGAVLMADGSRIPGILITISGDKIGRLAAISTWKGNFRFLNIPPGIYELTFELEGFKTRKRTVELRQDEVISLTILMETWSIR